VSETPEIGSIVSSHAPSFTGLSFNMKWNLVPDASVKYCQ